MDLFQDEPGGPDNTAGHRCAVVAAEAELPAGKVCDGSRQACLPVKIVHLAGSELAACYPATGAVALQTEEMRRLPERCGAGTLSAVHLPAVTFRPRFSVLACATALLLVVGVSALLYGCRRAPDLGVTVGFNRRLAIACIPKATAHSYWQGARDGVERAARELNVRIEWQGPLDDSKVADQIGIFNNLAASGVDAVLLSPCDDKALLPHVRNAMKRGIPVGIFDSPLAGQVGTDYVDYIGTDNHAAGELAAHTLIQAINATKEKTANAVYEGRLIVVRFTEGSASTRDRENGFLDVAASVSTLRILDKQYTDGSTMGAQHVAETLLDSYVNNNKLEVDGIFASNQPTTEGVYNALQALRDKGVQVRTRFVGFDESDLLLQGLRSGTIDALIVQDPEKMGYLGIKALVNYLGGKPVEPVVDTGTAVMTKADLRVPQ